MSNPSRSFILTLGVLGLCAAACGQKPSPAAETSATIGGKKVTIKYSAPSMRGRKIFGELVPYGQVWRAGANEATSLVTDGDIAIGSLTVPKGSYTLYVVPTADSWQLVINKQTGQWGTEYSQGQDLGRVPMKVSKTSAPVEKFSITLTPSGMLTMQWENTMASVPVTAK